MFEDLNGIKEERNGHYRKMQSQILCGKLQALFAANL